jgi:hypothetical protein
MVSKDSALFGTERGAGAEDCLLPERELSDERGVAAIISEHKKTLKLAEAGRILSDQKKEKVVLQAEGIYRDFFDLRRVRIGFIS